MKNIREPIRSSLVALAAGMLLSPAALAELTNDTLLGAGARDRPANHIPPYEYLSGLTGVGLASDD